MFKIDCFGNQKPKFKIISFRQIKVAQKKATAKKRVVIILVQIYVVKLSDSFLVFVE